MQTFLPSPDFDESAKALDNKRLGKQRVEVLQILKSLSTKGGWFNHPAVRMWAGHESSLIQYGLAICAEWIARGFKDTVSEKLRAMEAYHSEPIHPRWLGNEAFHASHRSNLLRKNVGHYSKHGWSEPHDLPYIWPTKVGF